MSRKKSKQRQAVPEEILAEGSGPVGEAVAEAVADEAADAPVEAQAADEPAESVKPAKKDRKLAKAAKAKAAPDAEAEVETDANAPADEAIAAAAVEETVEVVASDDKSKSRGRRKRGKQAASQKSSKKLADGDTSSDADADADAGAGAGAGGDRMVASSNDAEHDADADAARDHGYDDVTASSDDADADSVSVSASAADSASDADADADTGSELDANAERMSASGDEADGDALLASSDDAAADDTAADDTAGDDVVEGDDVVGDPITDEASVEAALLPSSLSPVQLRHLIEALIFATDKPVTLQRLRQLTRVSDVTRIEQALVELKEDYKDRGIALHQVSGGYQFRTNTAFSTWVQQLIQGRPVRLSRAQLETLAIVAYRQPITRPEIDEIRGVDSSATLRLLLDRSLIRVLGRREEVGRPTLYGTTKEFLDFFSLGDLRELPTLREYSELTAESRQVMSDRLGVSLDANGELLEPEGDEMLGDLDGDVAVDGTLDQGSIVDSILAEHAAAEAEAEARLDARHEVGADLAEAAMSGGSFAAFRDIFSDEPDPEAMAMSGEMSPTGSEARSYIDAIRAGALVEETLSDDQDASDALHASDEAMVAAHEAEVVSDELASVTTNVAATSNEVELASEELLAASEDLAAVVSDELEASHHQPVSDASPHVEQTSAVDDIELRADEHQHEHASESQRAAADEIELGADDHQVADHQIDEHRLASEASPHVGQTLAADDIELRVDEHVSASQPAAADEIELGADDHQVADHQIDEHQLVSEASPHVGQTPKAEITGLALGADENQLESESKPDAIADEVDVRAHETSVQPVAIEQRADEANQPNVESSSDRHRDELELFTEGAVQQPAPDPDRSEVDADPKKGDADRSERDADRSEGDDADKSSDPDDSSSN